MPAGPAAFRETAETLVEALLAVVDPGAGGERGRTLASSTGLPWARTTLTRSTWNADSAACRSPGESRLRPLSALDGAVGDFKINWVWLPPFARQDHRRRRIASAPSAFNGLSPPVERPRPLSAGRRPSKLPPALRFLLRNVRPAVSRQACQVHGASRSVPGQICLPCLRTFNCDPVRPSSRWLCA